MSEEFSNETKSDFDEKCINFFKMRKDDLNELEEKLEEA